MSSVQVPIGSLVQNPVIIANGQTESAEIITNGMSLCGLLLPAALTGTAITFEASDVSGGTYLPVYNSTGQVSYTVAANRYVAIDPKDFQGIQFLKIKSGSAEGAARTIICSLKGI
jgi:hypothetical protein